jgi:iron complex outermembrane recepter protein
MVRYVGERFGDAEHKQRIGDTFLADLMLNYNKKDFLKAKTLRASLELQNIFDKEYASVVNASDDTRAGSASYLVGAPFTALLKVSMEF